MGLAHSFLIVDKHPFRGEYAAISELPCRSAAPPPGPTATRKRAAGALTGGCRGAPSHQEFRLRWNRRNVLTWGHRRHFTWPAAVSGRGGRMQGRQDMAA